MNTEKTSGKQLRKSITKKLLSTFTELGNAKESKKIEKSVRKASKALASGLKAAQKDGAPRKKRGPSAANAAKNAGKETVA